MKLLLTSIFLIAGIIGFSQGLLNEIPDSLQENANEIILFDDTEFIIEDPGKAETRRHYKAIIMNDNADDLNEIYLYYNNFEKILNGEVITYTLYGDKIEKYKLNDFDDYSTKDGSIAGDSRVKVLEVISTTYPYIIEVEYAISQSETMFYPTWIPQSENQSVIQASYTISGAAANSFRHKSINIQPIEENALSTKWEVNNLKAFEYEKYSRSIEDYTVVVYTGPTEFQVDGWSGVMNTWEDLGMWQYNLMKSQNTLTPEQVKPILELIPEGATVLEKIKTIYNYMQENTRYVSIQLGVGGWQPFESGYVHEKKYGDCKALSFYTVSLLEAAGIRAHYTLINAGYRPSRKLHPDFPAKTSNHVIVTVPMKEDTIWLECTSQSNPFGYLGTFTSDRYAVMIKEDGGHLIKTKSYSPSENVQTTVVDLTINEDGTGKGDVTRTYKGLETDNGGFSDMALKPQSEQEKWFYDKYAWGSSSLQSIELQPITDEIIPTGKMKLSLDFERLASVNADRLFYKPFIFTNINWMKLPNSDRTKPIEMRYPYTQIDSIHVSFPEGYFPESLPKDDELLTEFGSYERKIVKQEEGYTVIRKFVLEKGTYAPEKYDAFRDFVKDVQKNDRKKLVMINKT